MKTEKKFITVTLSENVDHKRFVASLPQAACVVAIMMMMMITEAAAMPKTGRTHKHGATLETVSLQLDAKTLETHRHTRLLNNASISPWTYK